MKEIMENEKAVVAPITIIVVAVVVIAGIAIFVSTGEGTDSSKWETKNKIGNWGQEIILEYADGTTQSLKMLYDNPTLSVWHEGQEITGIYYNLNAKATGKGYSTVKFRFVDHKVMMQTKQGSTVVKDFMYIYPAGQYPTVAVDGNWHQIFSFYRGMDNQFPSTLSSGTYTLKFSHYGAIKYSADDEPYEGVALPPNLSMTMEFIGKTLTVELSSEIELQYENI